MISEVIPEAYDAVGRNIFRPDLQKHGLHPTLPIGRFFSKALSVKCRSIDDLQQFLSQCRYVSDESQFGKRDYW